MKFRLVTKGDCTHIELSGHIDEDVKHALRDIEAAVKTPLAVFDCEGIGKINSIGIKDWILAFDRLDKRFASTYVRCTTAFIDMATMVPSFTKLRPILSFATAFLCDTCQREKSAMIEVANGVVASLPEAPACDKCGAAMLQDDDLAGDIDFVVKLQRKCGLAKAG